MTTDQIYMSRCIQLARMGGSNAWPNPMVGAVIVRDGEVIGEGYHRRCGGPHAEVNAVASVKNQEWLRSATLYVSLEPCSHWGKTPPCADLIVEKQIPRVVVGCTDSNPAVAGRGIARLRAAGIEVTTGVLQEECRALNRRFFTVKEQNRPYVLLKWAQSADGFIDRQRGSDEPPAHLSSPGTQLLVHRLRSQYDAILVGRNTALMDDPQLTNRLWPGKSPLRMVLDAELTLPPRLALFHGSTPTLVVTRRSAPPADSPAVAYLTVDEQGDRLPAALCSALFARGIQSLMVEGGRQLLYSFIAAGLWDEARIEVAPQMLHGGVRAPQIEHCSQKSEKVSFGHRIVTLYR